MKKLIAFGLLLLLPLSKAGCMDSSLIKGFFGEIYVKSISDPQLLLDMLYDEDTDPNLRSTIVSSGNFTADELAEIFENFDDSLCLTAIKRICAADPARAYELALPILKGDTFDLSAEKLVASFLGAAAYFEITEDAQRDEIVSIIWNIHDTNSDTDVKAQAIYALARFCDYGRVTKPIRTRLKGRISVLFAVIGLERFIYSCARSRQKSLKIRSFEVTEF